MVRGKLIKVRPRLSRFDHWLVNTQPRTLWMIAILIVGSVAVGLVVYNLVVVWLWPLIG